MKYLEELTNGDFFTYNANSFLLTADFRIKHKNNQRMCIDISNGFVHWLEDNSVVEYLDLYYRDNDNNILSLKTPNHDTKNSHIS